MDWITSQRDLQIQMLAAMRLYGMKAVLPGFAGHIPYALTYHYPNANYTHTSDWGA
jgi:alpha-N-acetylglucosaminidase